MSNQQRLKKFDWLTIKDIKQRLLKDWQRAKFQRTYLANEPLFPLVIPIKWPSLSSLIDHFCEIKPWINELKQYDGMFYQIQYKTINHRSLGRQTLPEKIIFNDESSAFQFIKKQKIFAQFKQLCKQTLSQFPELRPFLEKHPNLPLAEAKHWGKLLAICDYLKQNTQPGCYIRELDLPNIDTKFIEKHKKVLMILLNVILPKEAVNQSAQGLANHGFERRFGFKYDEPLIRFRHLDPAQKNYTDISVRISEFVKTPVACETIFITENKINGLSFPAYDDAIVIFGLGYGIQQLKAIPWFNNKTILYWGDIDTHGFAMLNQLRGYYPQTKSLLMDEYTLRRYQPQWTSEPSPVDIPLDHLTVQEQQLYQSLIHDRFGQAVRLEQEFVRLQDLVRLLRRV